MRPRPTQEEDNSTASTRLENSRDVKKTWIDLKI
jgi:hypothetical protein